MIKIVTTHLKSGKENESVRGMQAKQLARETKKLDNVIITGDFSDMPKSEVYSAMKAQKFVDATELTGEP